MEVTSTSAVEFSSIRSSTDWVVVGQECFRSLFTLLPSSGYTLYTGSAKNAMCTYGCNDIYTLLAILLKVTFAESPACYFPCTKKGRIRQKKKGRCQQKRLHFQSEVIKFLATAPSLLL